MNANVEAREPKMALFDMNMKSVSEIMRDYSKVIKEVQKENAPAYCHESQLNKNDNWPITFINVVNISNRCFKIMSLKRIFISIKPIKIICFTH